MVLHEVFLVPFLFDYSEAMVWRGMEKHRIRAVQMDNFRGLLGIRRVDRVSNERLRVMWSDEKSG